MWAEGTCVRLGSARHPCAKRIRPPSSGTHRWKIAAARGQPHQGRCTHARPGEKAADAKRRVMTNLAIFVKETAGGGTKHTAEPQGRCQRLRTHRGVIVCGKEPCQCRAVVISDGDALLCYQAGRFGPHKPPPRRWDGPSNLDRPTRDDEDAAGFLAHFSQHSPCLVGFLYGRHVPIRSRGGRRGRSRGGRGAECEGNHVDIEAYKGWTRQLFTFLMMFAVRSTTAFPNRAKSGHSLINCMFS